MMEAVLKRLKIVKRVLQSSLKIVAWASKTSIVGLPDDREIEPKERGGRWY